MTVRMCPLLVAACLAAACDAPAEEPITHRDFANPIDPVAIPVPTEAPCEIDVKNHGVKAMESDYLPNVIACEAAGGASLATLEAQAIAARSYAYYFAETEGEICNGQGCQVFSCGRTPSELHYQAVANTSGVVLSYHDVLTVGFYVAGDDTPDADCVGNSAGINHTEMYVTYNEGRSGTDVIQTTLGWRHDPSDGDFGQNRGAMSQWGAHCLESNYDYDTVDILRYYYGEDIELVQIPGECVDDVDIDDTPPPSDDDKRPSDDDDDRDDTPADACTLSATEETSFDDAGNCVIFNGPSEYWREDAGGLGGSVRWTNTTEFEEYNVAVWPLKPQAAGTYHLQVHIDPEHTSATSALYEVVGSASARTYEIDQTEGGWIDLGVVRLDPDVSDQQVRLADLTGEPGQQLQVDVLRITPEGAMNCTGRGCRADDAANPLSPRNQVDDGCRSGGLPSTWVGLFVFGLIGLRRRRG